MAQLQFLNGSRDGELQDLVEEASLSLGQTDGQFIQVKDQGIEGEHALVYSVKGQFYVMSAPASPGAGVFVNFKKIGNTATAVSDKDILMFGRTVAKFWLKGAPAGTGAGPTMAPASGGGDSAKLTRERDDARSKLADVEKQLAAAQAGQGSAGQAQAALQKEKESLSKELDAKKKDLEAANKEKESSSKELSSLKKEKQDVQTELDTTKTERDDLKKSLDETKADLEKEKKRADDAEAEVAKSKPALEQKDKELEAQKTAIEALKATETLAKRDRRVALREGADLAKALEALSVPDSVRERVAAAVRDEVDREVLSRDGPVVPLRDLRCPACDASVESELLKLKARRRMKDVLRGLGVQEVPEGELRALADKVRVAAKA